MAMYMQKINKTELDIAIRAPYRRYSWELVKIASQKGRIPQKDKERILRKWEMSTITNLRKKLKRPINDREKEIIREGISKIIGEITRDEKKIRSIELYSKFYPLKKKNILIKKNNIMREIIKIQKQKLRKLDLKLRALDSNEEDSNRVNIEEQKEEIIKEINKTENKILKLNLKIEKNAELIDQYSSKSSLIYRKILWNAERKLERLLHKYERLFEGLNLVIKSTVMNDREYFKKGIDLYEKMDMGGSAVIAKKFYKHIIEKTHENKMYERELVMKDKLNKIPKKLKKDL